MVSWQVLLDVLILLAAALALGTLAEQLRLNAILGYLVAGTLVGPNVLGFVGGGGQVNAIAELGVALLLFTIGLEFSFRRLRRMGRVALLGGSIQVLVTTALAAAVAAALGLAFRGALAVGAMIAMSSTACVLRVLVDRGAVDSLHGRNAMGILLLQDLAVVPLLLLLGVLGGGASAGEAAILLGRTLVLATVLVGAFLLLFNVVVPRLMNISLWARNRELPILLAIVMALGSAAAAHSASLSPAMGAFVAGVLLGESPFAAQIRADVASLRTLFGTIFFASIGMLGEPAWVLHNWYLVLPAVGLILAGKTLIVWGIVRLLGFGHGLAAATGLCISQVGEFSFVLAGVSLDGGLIDEHTLRMVVSATIATLFLTPFLVGWAPDAAMFIETRWRRSAAPLRAPALAAEPAAESSILIVGFGPAGQAVAQALYRQHRHQISVLDLNPRNAAAARQMGLEVSIGDAMHREVLEHAGAGRAGVIAVTVPDPDSTRLIIHLCRDIAPAAAIVARARYHNRRWEMHLAGALEVVDEEEQVGLRIAAMARKHLGVQPEPAAEG